MPGPFISRPANAEPPEGCLCPFELRAHGDHLERSFRQLLEKQVQHQPEILTMSPDQISTGLVLGTGLAEILVNELIAMCIPTIVEWLDEQRSHAVPAEPEKGKVI
jgi:hypothetical protein